MSIFLDEEIVDNAFFYFRKRGFPYRKLPLHVCKQEINKLAELEDEKLATSNLGYQVADTYHPERFSTPANGMKSPVEGFHTDKTLRRCLSRMLSHGTGIKESLIGGVGGIAITSGVQGASNFRPAFALKLYRRFCKEGDTILDTSAGFGGRLVGFVAFGQKCRYIGIDPNPIACRNNLRMAHDLNCLSRVRMINLPVEDVDHSDFSESADFAFTSPPYFKKEYYPDSEKTQSWVRYPDPLEWKEKFLEAMMRFQFAALKPDCVSVVNIADVKLRSTTFPLVEWCAEAGTAAGFVLEAVETMGLQKRIGNGHEGGEARAKEAVLIFRKPVGAK